MSAPPPHWFTEVSATLVVFIHALQINDNLAQGRALKKLKELGVSIRIDLAKAGHVAEVRNGH